MYLSYTWLKNILDSDNLYTLYCSLILLYLNYVCEIWGNTYHSRVNCLILFQKKAICVVDKASYRERTDLLFVKYNCLKFENIVDLKH